MSSGSPTSEAAREFIQRLDSAGSENELLEDFPDPAAIAGHPLLLELCDQVNRLVRVDLRRAELLGRTVRSLAARSGDRFLVARSARALANVLHRQGEYVASMDHYEEALRGFKELGESEELALTRSTAIHNLIYLGNYDRAYRFAEEARAVFARRGDRLRLARLEVNFANILYRQDRWEEALAGYQVAYRSLREVGQPEDLAVCLRTMAVCQISLNRHAEALRSYEEARRFFSRHELPLLALENDYNIAYLHYQRGEYLLALNLYRAVRKMCETLSDREHLALCDLDQTEIFLDLNLLEEAAELAQSAFDQFQQLGMGYEAAKSLALLGVANSRRKKEFLALELMEKARRIFVDEKNRVWPAQLDLLRALVFEAEGRLIEAMHFAERALEAFELLEIHSRSVLCRLLMARLELIRGSTEKARARCQGAMDDLAELYSPALDYQAQFTLGRIEEARGNRRAAVDAFEASARRLERLRSHVHTDEPKISFLEDKLVVYESLVALLLETAPEGDYRKRVFHWIELAKSRSLADLMAFRAHVLPPKTATRSNLVDQVRSLREELNWYYRRIDLQQMKSDPTARGLVDELRRKSSRKEEDLVRTLREVENSDREFSSLQSGTTVELETLRAALPPGHMMLEYYIARGIVFGCLIGAETLEVIPLSVASRVRELHRLVQFQLSKFLLHGAQSLTYRDVEDRATQTHLGELYQELVAPFESRLEGEHLIIVPHDFLHHLPFQALVTADGKPLVERFSLSFAPTAGVYCLCRDKPRAAGSRALVVGVDEEGRERAGDEARAVAEMLSGSELLLGADASEENLRRRGADAAILHLATQGTFRRDNPMFSTLRLGDASISLFDLYGFKLGADLVTLTGCGLGLNVSMGSDELVGLARGILYAGARSLLVALWDVGEESSVDFLRRFYRHLEDSASPARALRRAVREIRSRRPHPYYWASWMLVGDPH